MEAEYLYIRWVETLREIEHAFLATRTSQETAHAALAQIDRLIPSLSAWVLSTGEQENRPRIWAERGLPLNALILALACLPTLRDTADLTFLSEAEFPRWCPADLMESLACHDVRALIWLPLDAHGFRMGSLGLALSDAHALDYSHLDLLEEIAPPLAATLYTNHLLEQAEADRQRAQSLSRQLVEIQEAERRHVASELHDQTGQLLTGLKMVLELCRQTQGEQQDRLLQEALTLVNGLIGQVHSLSLELRPAMLDDLGLLPTLLWHFDQYSTRTDIQIHFSHIGLEHQRLHPEIETACYRIIQESLNNIARYADVKQASVHISVDRAGIELEIRDAGIGFDPNAIRQSGRAGGLSGMQERAGLLGGWLRIVSSTGLGTRIIVHLPPKPRLTPLLGDEE